MYDTTKPTIVLQENVVQKHNIGDTLYIPTLSVKDNNDASLNYYVYIKTPQGILIHINRSKYDGFKLDKTGEYCLIYIVYDNAGNMNQKEYRINVE